MSKCSAGSRAWSVVRACANSSARPAHLLSFIAFCSTPRRVERNMNATAFRSHRCGALSRAELGQTVRLGGWVHRRRDLGGLVFIDLRDRDGLVQLSCNPAWTPPEIMERAAGLGDRKSTRLN